MNKRKIDVNQIKKAIVRGKKSRTIDVKYQVVLSYFKQKQVKQMEIFQITFFPLIQDILTQLMTAQLIYKIQQESKQPLKSILITGNNQNNNSQNQEENIIKLQSFYLKNLSKQYPIQQICQCLYIEKLKNTIAQKNEKNEKISLIQQQNIYQDKKILSIQKNKLMIFFKKLRLIYSDFCYCGGQKFIVQCSQFRNFYQTFKTQWSKRQEKGRLCEKGKLEKRLCRSLFFLGVLIENNIYEAIQQAQRKKRQQTDELGTKSQKKKNIKGINQNQSSTYSFGSVDLVSNFSLRLKSQKSNQDDFYIPSYYKNPYSEYSQKSERIISINKSKFNHLMNKIQTKNLQFKIKRQPKIVNKQDQINQRFVQINYLSNDVQNILIQQAFKIQKFKDSCNNHHNHHNTFFYMNQMNLPTNTANMIGPMNLMSNMNPNTFHAVNYYPIPNQPQTYDYSMNYHSGINHNNQNTFAAYNLYTDNSMYNSANTYGNGNIMSFNSSNSLGQYQNSSSGNYYNVIGQTPNNIGYYDYQFTNNNMNNTMNNQNINNQIQYGNYNYSTSTPNNQTSGLNKLQINKLNLKTNNIKVNNNKDTLSQVNISNNNKIDEINNNKNINIKQQIPSNNNSLLTVKNLSPPQGKIKSGINQVKSNVIVSHNKNNIQKLNTQNIKKDKKDILNIDLTSLSPGNSVINDINSEQKSNQIQQLNQLRRSFDFNSNFVQTKKARFIGKRDKNNNK